MTRSKSNNSGCLSLLFPFLGLVKDRSDTSLPYRLRDDFLSQAELSFYKVVSNLLTGPYVVQSKVRLADIFFVSRPQENMSYLSKIDRKHVDFLVCDAVSMKPLLGIELDDSSHRRSSRQQRDEFVNEVFQAAGFPLVRIPVGHVYNVGELTAQIKPYLQKQGNISKSPPAMGVEQQRSSPPLCPKCGIPMVIRSVSQGPNKGKQFYGCKNYPRCHELKPISIHKSN